MDIIPFKFVETVINISIVAFIVLALLELYIRISTYRLGQCVKNIPRMRRLPIIGDVLETGSITPDSYGVFQALHKKNQQLGPIYQAWLGPLLYIIVADPKVIQAVLNSQTLLVKGNIYGLLKSWLGNGILITDGDFTWRLHRKLITPAFNYNALEIFLHIFNSHSNKFLKNLQKHVNGPEVDIVPYALRYTLESICESAMGIDIGAVNGEESEYSKAVLQYTNVFIKRAMQPWLHNDFIFTFSQLAVLEQKCLKTLNETAEKVIQQKKAEYLAQKTDTNIMEIDCNKDERKCKSVMEILLKAALQNSLITDKDILDEVNNFMFAGQDSTTSGSYFTLLMLALHQDIQDKVYEEQLQVFGDSMRDSKMEDVSKMKYLDMVVKETLRMYPPVPLIIRKVTEDLQVGEYQLPKGSNVLLNLYSMQHDPRLYPSPEIFDPERFSAENFALRDPSQYLPFSTGPRNCLGNKYATLEIKSLISKVIRHYKLLPGSTKGELETLTAEVVLRAIGGIKIKVTSRK